MGLRDQIELSRAGPVLSRVRPLIRDLDMTSKTQEQTQIPTNLNNLSRPDILYTKCVMCHPSGEEESEHIRGVWPGATF